MFLNLGCPKTTFHSQVINQPASHTENKGYPNAKHLHCLCAKKILKLFLKNVQQTPANAQLLINNFLLCTSHSPSSYFCPVSVQTHCKAPVPSPGSKGCCSTLLSTTPTPVLRTPRWSLTLLCTAGYPAFCHTHRWKHPLCSNGSSCDSVCAHLFGNRKPLRRVWLHLLYPTSPHIYTQR